MRSSRALTTVQENPALRTAIVDKKSFQVESWLQECLKAGPWTVYRVSPQYESQHPLPTRALSHPTSRTVGGPPSTSTEDTRKSSDTGNDSLKALVQDIHNIFASANE